MFKIYDVDEIIRIGTSGSFNKDMELLDVVLATSSYSFSSFPKAFDGDCYDYISSSSELNDKIISTAQDDNIDLKIGNIITSDIFDPYVDFEKYIKNYPSDVTFLAMEMEAFGLFYLAKKLNKKATSLMTIVDIIGKTQSLTSEEREKSLNEMIKLALDSIIK